MNPIVTPTSENEAGWSRVRVEERAAQHHQWNPQEGQFNPHTLVGADLRYLDLHNIDFSGMNMNGADLRHTSLTGCHFIETRLQGARFEEAKLGPSQNIWISDADLIGATGLFGSKKAIFRKHFVFDPHRPPKFEATWDNLGMPTPSWRNISFIGSLPIFGVSNLTLAAVVAYAGIADWYNHQILKLQARFDFTPEHFQELIGRLQPLPQPTHLGRLLLILVALSAASLLYKCRCPDIVKEFSEQQWQDRRDTDIVEYWSANFSRFVSRFSCSILYLVFGGWALFYLAKRLWVAFSFFWF